MYTKTKIFSSLPQNIFAPLPCMIEIQLFSYNWLVKKGLKELFDEISPIKDYTGKELELYFENYHFDEPKYEEREAKKRGITYESSLRVNLKLANKKNKSVKTQEVYFGDFPKMTPRGTFIINGVERVIVSQLIRSPGVYFTARQSKNRKLFGAKVIPNRGAWLEFETEFDNTIYVKIDRKRKIPATALLRIFGLDSNEEILKTFAPFDIGQYKYIASTLKKDVSKDKAAAFVEIYKRIRPGDLATPENAKSLIEAMFFRFDRYDLSEAGRFKMNQRLEFKTALDKNYRSIRKEDLIEIIKNIIRKNNDALSEPDDIDHLGNRRLRACGELIQGRSRIGLARMRRIIQDRMSTLDVETLLPAQLINTKPLTGVIKDFFASSQLSQFMDQVNPLASLEQKRRLSAMGPGGLTRERAGFEVRDVHSSHYGRICPIETPEGGNIGLVGHISVYARINEYGFLETPYFKVKNGKITKEIVYFNGLEEEKYKIAHGGIKRDEDGNIKDKQIEARVSGIPGICKKEEIDFIDVAPFQIFSNSTSLIPFLAHDDANRALMGSNMQRQAVVYLAAEAPLVGTGLEEKIAADSGELIIAEEDGEVKEVDANHIKISSKSLIKTYELNKFVRSNQYTCINQRPIVKVGDRVSKGNILTSGPSIDKHGALALGKNLLVAFVSWGGANFEDAIVISERLVKDDIFSSIHIEDFYCDVRETKIGSEITTPDIPNVSEEKLKELDEEGIIRIGAEVKAGDILVGKISPKGEAELTSEERLLRAIFGEKARDVKDTSLTLPYGERGRVVGIHIFSRDRGDKLDPGIIKRIQVEVAQIRKVTAGDKLAGRHGNKGVISRILPEEEMPFLEDGTPIDIILNPLSVASRMNIGQILETHLGWAAKKLGYRALVPPFAGATEEQIKKELKEAGLPEDGKIILYNGRTGEAFDQKVTVGYAYMMKLIHLVEDKIHMRSTGPYSLITQQPLGGKAQLGGQRFGEMEVWALEGYGASHTLQEMITIKSDDVMGRTASYDAIVKGEKIQPPSIPASFNVLVNELKALGLAIELKKEE